MIRRMLKEEWRMHSSLYHGASFATFPIVVFLLSFSFSWMVIEYSILGTDSLGKALQFLGIFLGLAVGSLGFSSRDALRNVLGPMNLLVYSSRTLPISERKLLFDFVVKDVIYYSLLFILPVALGPLILSDFGLIPSVGLMVIWFLAGLLVSLLAARGSVKLIPGNFLNYEKLSLMNPLSAKSVLDVSRSSGGLIKVLFSISLLTFFYWFTVLYFPVTRDFLSNPLLSFSVMLGTLNLSVYNWLNRFDSIEKYEYLPVDRKSLLNAKSEAFLYISVPLTISIVLVSYLVYSSDLLVSVVSAMTTTFYTLVISLKLTGLNPNRKIFDSRVFLKFLLLYSLVVVPLLLLSIVYSSSIALYYVAFCIFVITVSGYFLRSILR